MGRPTSKPDLIQTANEQFEKLQKLVGSMTLEEQTAAFDFGDLSNKKEAHWTRDRNLRDVLIHLYEWHQLLLDWAGSNKNGVAKPFLPLPYNWKNYGKMNEEIWAKHQDTSLEASKEMLLESHRQVMEMIEGFTNEELFERKHYSWTGTTTIGAYCISATSSHYDWAIKKLKAHVKAVRNA